ncbi:MAG TPA: PEP-CTERM sorting domain-containing protein [Fimbriimonadaceae bacterium]|nr:PEP-CTERM sorting domain-containing protein [Fimbriimonadaceae bacterium]
MLKLISALSLALISTFASANLVQNASFETVPGTGTGEGLLPSDWVQFNSSADTFSSDGSYGLDPNFGGRFPGVVAQDGLRWVAGNSIEPEEFGQFLNTPLVEGDLYRISAWIHRSARTDMPDNGTFVVTLRNETDTIRVLGAFEPTANYVWEYREFEFAAPTNSANLNILGFSPLSAGPTGAYMGLDNVRLEAVPEPSSLLAFAALGLILVRRKR